VSSPPWDLGSENLLMVVDAGGRMALQAPESARWQGGSSYVIAEASQ